MTTKTASKTNKTVIHIKADRSVKEQAHKVASRLGVPLSVVVNAFLKQFIRTEEITLASAPTMTPELEAVLFEVEQDRREKKNISGPFSVEEAIAHLSAL